MTLGPALPEGARYLPDFIDQLRCRVQHFGTSGDF